MMRIARIVPRTLTLSSLRRLSMAALCGPFLTGVGFAGGEIPSSGDHSFRRGDANQDGGLDVSDPVWTLQWAFLGQGSPTCFDALDTNDDGAADISDAIFSLEFLFLGGVAIPYPAQRCDRDPTPDEIDCVRFTPCVCGGFAGFPCDNDDDFCDLPPGSCNTADLQGSCVPIHEACPRIYDPVCGCDGVTYSNECERIRARAQKDHDGPCEGGAPFRTLAQGESSGASEQTTIVRDESTWVELWSEHGSVFEPPPELPKVDFESEMVVVAVRHFTSGGYHLKIDHVVPTDREIEVHLTQVVPSGDCPTTDALTQPFHFVATAIEPGEPSALVTVSELCCSRPMAATGVGACEKLLGWLWDGLGCRALSGCECEGEDCDELFGSPDACRAAYHGCPMEEGEGEAE